MARNFFTSSVKSKIYNTIIIGTGGVITFGTFGIYLNNEKFYKQMVIPLLQKIDPETSHNLSISLLKYRIPFSAEVKELNSIKSKVLGLNFRNPVGISAGFDKNGEAVEGLARMGFGFVEVGSITPKPQPGNSKPRVFRLSNSKGIINRYGFNSDGHDVVYDRLIQLNPPGKRAYVLGINLGKNKDSADPVNDYVLGVKKFGCIADYLVINVSSPNTPGLRLLQQKLALEKLINAVLRARDDLPLNHQPPILLKLSPDLSHQEKEEIACVISQKKCKVDGLIISNTTLERPDVIAHDKFSNESGGLSGEPLKELSLQSLKDMAILTEGKIPIIAAGGIGSGKDALERIYYGASLIQFYSALVYDGPPIVSRIQNELEELLREDGFESIKDAVGCKLPKK